MLICSSTLFFPLTDCSPHGCAHSLTQIYKHKGYLHINISSFCESSINRDVLIFSLRTSFHIIATTFERLGVPKGIYFIYRDYWIKLTEMWVSHLVMAALKYNLGRRARVQIRSVVLRSFEQFLHLESVWNTDGAWMNWFFSEWHFLVNRVNQFVGRNLSFFTALFFPLIVKYILFIHYLLLILKLDCGLFRWSWLDDYCITKWDFLFFNSVAIMIAI